MTEQAAGIDRYLASFGRLKRREPAWLDGLRRAAIDRFAQEGFPTTRHEAWRYTNVAAIARAPFETAPAPPALSRETIHAAIDDATFGGWDAVRIVFVNGAYRADLSREDDLPAGVTVEPLAGALSRGGENVSQVLAGLSPGNPFTALNTAFFTDGAVVRIARGAIVPRPLHLVFASADAPGRTTVPRVSYPRCVVIAEPGSQAAIVETYLGVDVMDGFTNAVTEVDVREDAVLDHARLQREAPGADHIGALFARVGRTAAYRSHAISLGARLNRLDLEVTLAAEGADVTLNGLYVLNGRQHSDHHTLVDHAAPHGTSRELYKGVLDGSSHGVFDGTVVVRQAAQKTDSRQENRNLILSSEALVDSKPTLRINADDVKCSHAATIGQMDEASMFYLRSRALDVESARRLLIHGFVADVVDRLGVVPLRDGLESLLAGGPEPAS